MFNCNKVQNTSLTSSKVLKILNFWALLSVNSTNISLLFIRFLIVCDFYRAACNADAV